MTFIFHIYMLAFETKRSWAWKNVSTEFLSGFLLRMKQDIVAGSHLYSRNLYYEMIRWLGSGKWQQNINNFKFEWSTVSKTAENKSVKT